MTSHFGREHNQTTHRAIGLGLDHEAHRLVEGVDLERQQSEYVWWMKGIEQQTGITTKEITIYIYNITITAACLVGLQVTDGGRHGLDDLLHVRPDLARLHDHKVPVALLRDLDERVARHVLHALVTLWSSATMTCREMKSQKEKGRKMD